MIFCAAASRKAGGALPAATHPEKLPVTGFQGGKLPEAAFLGIRQKDKRNGSAKQRRESVGDNSNFGNSVRT